MAKSTKSYEARMLEMEKERAGKPLKRRKTICGTEERTSEAKESRRK